jgi:2-phospho-L-lactate guanylyltransferase
MIFAVLPVKAPENAKQRLSGFLSPAQREALARTLYEQMLEKLRAARGLDRIAVITNDACAARLAREAGALVFDEDAQISHSRSADAAARRAAQLGARSVLLLPIDVPLATTAEIEQLAAAAVSRPLVIVPSADGTGTNALARTPPDAIPSCFGPGSFELHLGQARSRGFEAEVLRLPGLMFDIDTPEDALELLARAPHCSAAKILRGEWASTSQA